MSAGYLRFFSERTPRGAHKIQLYDLRQRRSLPPVSVRDALVSTNHNSVVLNDLRLDELEHEWQQVETAMLPFLQRMVAGELHPAREPKAVVALMAVHLARAAGTEAVHERILAAAMDEQPSIMARNRKLRGMASPEAIRKATKEALEVMAGSRQLRVEGMARHYNWFCQRFDDYSVQVARVRSPRRVGFITSDNPTVLSDSRRVRVGVQNIAVMDASEVYIALSPWLLVALSRERKDDLEFTPADVQHTNQITRRAAIRWLVAHPAEDITRAAF